MRQTRNTLDLARAVAVVAVSHMALVFSDDSYPWCYNDYCYCRKLFRIIVTGFTLFGTMIAFIKPAMNSFFMMLMVIPGIIVMYLELKR